MNILELQNLEKNFGENKVLKGVDLQAEQGDVISRLRKKHSFKMYQFFRNS